MSYKNQTPLTKFLIVLLPIVLAVFIILSFVVYEKINTIKNDVYEKEKNSLQVSIQKKLDEKLISLENIVLLISKNSSVLNGMYDEDRDMIFNELYNLRVALTKNKSFLNPLIQVVDPMLASYVKSWNKKAYGADVSMRKSVKFVAKNMTNFIGAEITRAGIMMVATAPLIYIKDEESDYIGSIDFILRFNALSYQKTNPKDTKQLLILVNKSKLEGIEYINNPYFIDKYFIDNGKEKIKDALKKRASRIDFKILRQKGYVIDTKYFYTYKTIHNLQNEDIGVFLIVKPIEEVNTMVNEASSALTFLIIIFFVMMIMVLLALVFIYKGAMKESARGANTAMMFYEKALNDATNVNVTVVAAYQLAHLNILTSHEKASKYIFEIVDSKPSYFIHNLKTSLEMMYTFAENENYKTAATIAKALSDEMNKDADEYESLLKSRKLWLSKTKDKHYL